MSPDIEWQVGDDADRETIARITTRKPSRWRKPLLLAAVALGTGLGLIYLSIPEPPPKPIAPAPPTALPVAVIPAATRVPPTSQPFVARQLPVTRSALENAVLREAHALAEGDPAEYITIQDPGQYQRRQDALAFYSVWGRPAASQIYYTIWQTGTFNADIAWAEVVQYRDGQYYREVRFFKLINDQWKRTRAVRDTAFWGISQTLTTLHFHVTYSARDEDAVKGAAAYLEQRYEQVCQIYGCADQPGAPVININFQPATLEASAEPGRDGRSLTVDLPTPGIMGQYYSTLEATALGHNESLDEFFDRYLFLSALFETAGNANTWLTSNEGVAYLYAIGRWELKREGRPAVNELSFLPAQAAKQRRPLPPDKASAITQADDLIQFIDETYGPDILMRFFRALRVAQSLPHAIEVAGLPASEFEAKWAAWLKEHANS